MIARVTLENHCTRTAQSEHGGCSRRVHEMVYLAVNKGNILVNILLLKIFIAYTILCTRRLQPPRDDCDVRVQLFSSVKG